ncbi:hypothetical protein HZC08_01420 [Candidatus Micrarchaeota archaeon]|nr:hypothetical protein [Candidatus Micrarchaeota archaeon]
MFHGIALSSSGASPAPAISDFDSMKIKIPAGLGAICSNDWLRGFTAVSEVGWGLIICLPLLITGVGFQACWDTVTEVVYPITVMGFQTIWGSVFLSQAINSSINIELIFNIVSDFLQKLNYVVVLSYIDTLTVAIITIVGTKSVSAALGGEYYLFGLQRLV